MKRGGSVVSKGACRAAAKAGDYCEPDRAQRDRWFESSTEHHHSGNAGFRNFLLPEQMKLLSKRNRRQMRHMHIAGAWSRSAPSGR